MSILYLLCVWHESMTYLISMFYWFIIWLHAHCARYRGCHQSLQKQILSIIAVVSTDFPMYQWERLLPQAELTLNLIWKYNTTPTVLAYSSMFGPLDYNIMALSPMGCAVLIYENSNARASWDNHAVYSWYLYISPEHYRAHVCRVKNTNADQLLDTVVFKHKNITEPTITHSDRLVKAIHNLKQSDKRMSNGKGDTSMRDL